MRDIRPIQRTNGAPPLVSRARSGAGVVSTYPEMRMSASRPSQPPAQQCVTDGRAGAAHRRSASSPRSTRSWRRWFWGVGGLVLLLALVAGLRTWYGAVRTTGEVGYQALEAGARALEARDIATATRSLDQARAAFARGERLLLGSSVLVPVVAPFPGLDRLVSGIALMSAGRELALGAKALTVLIQAAAEATATAEQPVSLLRLLQHNEAELIQGNAAIQQALQWLSYVTPESLPGEQQDAYQRHEALLRFLAHTLNLSVTHIDLLKELLGEHGPRLYLFLFQNNHELRPTGGFIGSYALLDVTQGEVRRFFVDGIFNPDGQLKENIVPPAPIQKISAGWSLHDSNWFPDFPTAAEKARFFYEKTGGPTTDGVVTLTPNVLAELLRIMGPVPLPEYGVTIDATNFLPLIQTEVELDYDQEENNPKKILGDLTGVILKRLIDTPDPARIWQLAEAVTTLLNERHILLFARDARVQQLIHASGWSGEMLSTPYDYLAVVHANINGYKTDGVIQDDIAHRVALQSDGTLIDTVTVTRTHEGGATPYEWWNKVNANYMRVYVPLGSELLSAEGMTREFPTPPLQYDALGFRRDPDVIREEDAIQIHAESGTRIGTEFGKTVFGNWVYVSPGESVQVTYRYRLPFRLALSDPAVPAPFSVLYQKQAGTSGARLTSQIEYGDDLTPIWQSDKNLIPYGRVFKQTFDFERNTFAGFVFQSVEH